MSIWQDRWDRTVEAMKADVPGFDIGYKTENKLQRLITKIMFWGDYMQFVSTLAPKVYFQTRESVEERWPWETLQHEWVHLKDADTFYGLLPFKMRVVNRLLFAVAYLTPQIFAVGAFGAFGAFWNLSWLWCLLFLLFLLPIPSPFRAWAEIRGYRRSVETWPEETREERIALIVPNFTGPSYYFMLPFKGWVLKLLTSGSSPYREQMDELL